MKKQITRYLRKSSYFVFFLTLMSVQEFYAQQISGQVTDETNQGVPGVNVLKQGSVSGISTDIDGKFSIAAKEGDVLMFSFIGYNPQNIKVGKNKVINVKLVPNVASLEEVVVIGYGTARKKDLTGAVSQISAKSFEDQPLSRVEDALQGRASGVTVSKSSGAPGAGVKIRIRGVNSITGNNDPLVVIDGIIGGDLRSINPNDIASMDILKDASSTAIYGSRGSNGVIMITTKRGSGKAKIDVDYFTTISEVPRFLDQLNAADFATIENARRVRVGGSPIFTDADINELKIKGGTNYQDEIYKVGITKTLQLSASGSEGKIRYYLSGNYVDQEGIVINTGYKRGSLRANVSTDVTDKLKVTLNLFGSKENTKNDLNGFNLFQGSPLLKAVTWDPTTPVYDANGNYNLRSIRGIGSLNDNPVFLMNETDLNDFRNRVSGNLNLNYSFTNNFSYSLISGMTLTNFSSQKYLVETPDHKPNTSYNSNANETYQVSNILAWNKDYGKHGIKLTGVYEFSGYQNRNNSFAANQLSLPLGYYLFPAVTSSASQTANTSFNELAIESVMGRAEYNYDQKLLLTATVRNDASSVFQNNKSKVFPSFALAYNFNDLLNENKYLNSVKLRAGYGEVGNAGINPYGSYGLLGNNQYSFDGTSASTGSILVSFNNPDLKWETTKQFNVGLDFGLFDNILNLAIDGYVKNTTDLLLNVPVSNTNGGNNGAVSLLRNVGSIRNKGIDISLSGDILKVNDFTWNSNLNVSFMKNEVVDLYDNLNSIDGTFYAPGGQARPVNVIEKGQPIGQLYGAVFLGTWKTTDNIPTKPGASTPIAKPGDAKYKLDDKFDPVFESIGNGTPKALWGFNNTFTYKNWDLNFFMQAVTGFDVYNLVQASITGGAGDSRSFLAADQVNQWTATNETDIPANSTYYNSSRFVEKGDFIRLSNLNVGYTFKGIKGVDAIKIYAGGQNLFLITNYSGYDPEHTSSTPDGKGNDDVRSGINTGAYPNPRVYNIGVKVTL
ncbi:TonB-dependent receptor [Flavobacterium sp. NG2]|uniref:SusC/RagA family TonB-linked outer membrane protein n=1 Tax=Flavobacterium sp. NG2 TaxID=3097547 RepID=UPI002A8117AE|nr:TonB-dependent receptor [Flavobacterium sp. NG2]WPR73025.1 TonB-dependent receptor [Flavobacterium sp. NG2]